MLEAVSNFSLVATPDSKLYAIGGSNPGGYSSAVQVYDLSTKQWSPRSSLLPPARLVIAVLGSDGRIYAIGGTVTGSSYATRVDVYDPATDRWSPSATLPIGTAFAAATADGSDIFIAGGISYNGGLGAMLEHGCLCPWPATGLVRRPASRATPLVTRRQSATSPPATIHPSRGQVFVTPTARNR
jgi:hypothetical protein